MRVHTNKKKRMGAGSSTPVFADPDLDLNPNLLSTVITPSPPISLPDDVDSDLEEEEDPVTITKEPELKERIEIEKKQMMVDEILSPEFLEEEKEEKKRNPVKLMTNSELDRAPETKIAEDIINAYTPPELRDKNTFCGVDIKRPIKRLFFYFERYPDYFANSILSTVSYGIFWNIFFAEKAIYNDNDPTPVKYETRLVCNAFIITKIAAYPIRNFIMRRKTAKKLFGVLSNKKKLLVLRSRDADAIESLFDLESYPAPNYTPPSTPPPSLSSSHSIWIADRFLFRTGLPEPTKIKKQRKKPKIKTESGGGGSGGIFSYVASLFSSAASPPVTPPVDEYEEYEEYEEVKIDRKIYHDLRAFFNKNFNASSWKYRNIILFSYCDYVVNNYYSGLINDKEIFLLMLYHQIDETRLGYVSDSNNSNKFVEAIEDAYGNRERISKFITLVPYHNNYGVCYAQAALHVLSQHPLFQSTFSRCKGGFGKYVFGVLTRSIFSEDLYGSYGSLNTLVMKLVSNRIFLKGVKDIPDMDSIFGAKWYGQEVDTKNPKKFPGNHSYSSVFLNNLLAVVAEEEASLGSPDLLKEWEYEMDICMSCGPQINRSDDKTTFVAKPKRVKMYILGADWNYLGPGLMENLLKAKNKADLFPSLTNIRSSMIKLIDIHIQLRDVICTHTPDPSSHSKYIFCELKDPTILKGRDNHFIAKSYRLKDKGIIDKAIYKPFLSCYTIQRFGECHVITYIHKTHKDGISAAIDNHTVIVNPSHTEYSADVTRNENVDLTLYSKKRRPTTFMEGLLTLATDGDRKDIKIIGKRLPSNEYLDQDTKLLTVAITQFVNKCVE